MMLLRSIMGLDSVRGRLLVDPKIPIASGWIEVLDIPGAWGRADAFGRGTIEVDVDSLEASVLGTTAGRSTAPQESYRTRAG